MKKLIFIVLIFLSCRAFSQQTYWTSSPAGWSSLSSPAFRYKSNTPDSLNSLLIFNPLTGRYNEIYTAVLNNKRFVLKSDSGKFIQNRTTLQPNANMNISGSVQANGVQSFNLVTTGRHIFNGTNSAIAGIGEGYTHLLDLSPTANNDVLTQVYLKGTFSTGNAVATVNTIVGGSGYVDNTYTNVQLTNISVVNAVNPTATIVVSGGQVTTVTPNPGSARQQIGNTLVLFNPLALGGSGGGFSCHVATLSQYTGQTNYQLRVDNAPALFAPATSSYGSIVIPAGVTYAGSKEGTISNYSGDLYAHIGGVESKITNQTGIFTDANNGVTNNSGIIQLGSPLLHNTNIGLAGNQFTIGNPSSGSLFYNDGSNVELSGINGSQSAVLNVTSYHPTIEHYVQDGSNTMGISMSVNNPIFIFDNIFNTWASYDKDNSVNGKLSDLSIPDWGSVKSRIDSTRNVDTTKYILNQTSHRQSASYVVDGAGAAHFFVAGSPFADPSHLSTWQNSDISLKFQNHFSDFGYNGFTISNLNQSVNYVSFESDSAGNRWTGFKHTFDTLRTYKRPLTSYDVINRRSGDSLYVETGIKYSPKAFVTPAQFGADTTGTTDALAAFNAAKATGFPIWIPDNHIYKLSSTFTSADNSTLFGRGMIKFSGIKAIIPGNNSTIDGVHFKGNKHNSSSTTEFAIWLRAKNNVHILNCKADSIATAFFYADSTGGAGGIRYTNSLLNNHAENCTAMIHLGQRGEYINIQPNTSRGCDTAIVRLGGNSTITGGEYINGTIGLYDGSDAINEGHTEATGAVFNHNVYNLIVNNIRSIVGNVYSNCAFENGGIQIINSGNINILGGNMTFTSVDTLKNTNSQISLTNVNIGASPHYTEVAGGSPTHNFKNNHLLYTSTTAEQVLYQSAAILASSDFLNQGTTTTVPHGNAAGNPSWSAVSLTADVSGALPVANGGTGSTTQNFIDLTTNQSIPTGIKSFGAGSVSLNNSTSNWLLLGAGAGSPTFTTRSVGTKLILASAISGALTDDALGIESGGMWFGVTSTANQFRWYGGTTVAATLTGSGTFSPVAIGGTVTATTQAAGTNNTTIATTAHVFAERTNTATLTNKTLTSPVINVGSDATGDVYYRNAGVLTRIGIPAVGNFLASTGTIPAYTAFSSLGTGNFIYWNGSNWANRDIIATGRLNWNASTATISLNNQSHTIFTPTTGGTVTLVNNQGNIINPSGALVALTLALPASPVNNDEIRLTFTQAVTTISYSGGTVVGGLTSISTGGQYYLTYDSGTSTWY